MSSFSFDIVSFRLSRRVLAGVLNYFMDLSSSNSIDFRNTSKSSWVSHGLGVRLNVGR